MSFIQQVADDMNKLERLTTVDRSRSPFTKNVPTSEKVGPVCGSMHVCVIGCKWAESASHLGRNNRVGLPVRLTLAYVQ